MHNKSTSFQIMFVSISKQNFNSFLKRLTFDKINMFLIHKNEWETDLSNLFLSHKIGFHNAKISKKLPIDPYIKKIKDIHWRPNGIWINRFSSLVLWYHSTFTYIKHPKEPRRKKETSQIKKPFWPDTLDYITFSK